MPVHPHGHHLPCVGGFATAPLTVFPPPSILHSVIQGLLQNGKPITWLPCLIFGCVSHPLPGQGSHRGPGFRVRRMPPPQLRSYGALYLQGGVQAPPHRCHAPAPYSLRATSGGVQVDPYLPPLGGPWGLAPAPSLSSPPLVAPLCSLRVSEPPCRLSLCASPRCSPGAPFALSHLVGPVDPWGLLWV